MELETKNPFLPFAKGKCKYLTLEKDKNYVLKRSQFSLFKIFAKIFANSKNPCP
jgi:hypothetical protein